MYRYFERNGKKILAVLGVFLMIAFIIPSGFRNSTMRTHGAKAGTLGKTAVYSNELHDARAQWVMLTHPQAVYRGKEFAVAHLGFVLAGLPAQQMGMGAGTEGEIDRHPDLFFLLSHEAEQQGVRVSDDLVNTVIANELFVISQQSVNSEALKTAVRRVLEIGALHDRLASSVKISQPALLHENAANWQSIRLNLVEFNVNELKGAVTQPTTQQVQQQFEAYKGVTANSPIRPAGDPLGFGYQVPNRVKLQYIAITRPQVMEAVRATKSAYDWDVAARMYYHENQQEFNRLAPPTTSPATQPTTQPATQASAIADTQPTTQPASLPAVATTQPATQPAGPTTRPFAEVRQEILDKLLAPDADKLATEVGEAIRKRIEADAATFAAKGSPTSQPTTQPSTATTQPVPYNSYAYLESVAADIQKQYKLLPEVHQLGEWLDATELAKLPDIGQARTADGNPFPDYAITDAAPFSPTTLPSAGKLALWQPSTILTDTAKNQYLFRLTEASPAHAPELNEIAARVEEDAKTKAAYAIAAENARKLLDEAKKTNLATAAVSAHKPVTSTGYFRLSRPFIPNFIAGPAATNALVGKAKALYEEATPDHPHPVALVEMPSERKVVVVELADVSADASPSELFSEKLRALEGEKLRQTETLAQKWFNYDAVANRLNWKPEAGADKDAGS